jgi:hypothetical protein
MYIYAHLYSITITHSGVEVFGFSGEIFDGHRMG